MDIKKIVYISLGTLFVILGFIGVLLPVMPTTPFLLVAAWFYSRSSDKFHNWLLTNKILGKYIYNYINKRGMEYKDKVISLISLWLAMPTTIYFVENMHARIVVGIVLVSVSIHILTLNTIKADISDKEN